MKHSYAYSFLLMLPVMLYAADIKHDIFHGNIDNIQLALDQGVDVNMMLDDDDNTLLTYAIVNYKHNVVNYLLGRGADPNRPNNLGLTPLVLAIIAGNDPLFFVEPLLDHNADPNKPDDQGNLPLVRAVIEGDLNLVKYLVERGADKHLKNGKGRTALDYAVEKGDVDIIDFLTSD